MRNFTVAKLTKQRGAEHGLERFLNGRYSYMRHELVHQCITTFLQNQNSRNQLDYQTKNTNNQISGKNYSLIDSFLHSVTQ